MSTDPGYVRAQIDAAKHRAGQRQTRLLIIALLGLAIVASAAMAGFFISYGQSRKNAALTKRVIAQGKDIKQLAEDLARSSQTGRDILKRLSDATASSATQTVHALQQLDNAQRQGRADQLKKIAQMFEQCRALPCSPSVVNRILAQPVPVPTFGASVPTAGSTVRSVGGSEAPAPSPAAPSPPPSSASCPGIQVAPLNAVQICIPPPH